MDVRIACSSLLWGGTGLTAADAPAWLDDVVAAGYDGVSCFDGELLRFAAAGRFGSQLDERSLALASVVYFLGDDDARLHAVCSAMAALSCHDLVTLGGSRGAPIEALAERLADIAAVARAYGVHVEHHNHTDATVETLEEAERLLALTDPHVLAGFVDVGHATKDFAPHPVPGRAALFLARNWARIRLIELKDWSPESDLATEVGAGETGWSAVFALLAREQYEGWLVVEQNAPTPGRPPVECAANSRRFIAACIDAVRP